jgi:LuxR family maltose regulon positive regulatory protein
MTAGTTQPKVVRREQRIIERPRLIKLLDETDARTILLLAPAGYGKTTLARQWAKTLNGAVWVTLSSAHADVAWLAQDVAQAVAAADRTASRAIREHIQARPNPQRASRELGLALGERLAAADIRWLILDDYQEIRSSKEAEELVATIEREAGLRMLVTSRARPSWASGRRFVYGEVFEISRSELAMTEVEATSILGEKPTAVRLSEQARGWPAVVGLAAAAESAVIPETTIPQALHRYLAEELFQRASSALQDGLLTLALHGTRSVDVRRALGPEQEVLVAEAQALGFSSSDTTFQLHPLLREFLLEKLVALPEAEQRVREAIAMNSSDGIWDQALSLILRFDLLDLVEATVVEAFNPLARSGRLATLAAFAKEVRARAPEHAGSIGAILAEVAFRDGNFELALDLAQPADPGVGDDHPLASRIAAISGQIAFLQADFVSAEAAFRRARESARDDRDEAEASYGIASARIFGEQASAVDAVDVLRKSRDRSPFDFLRFVSSEIALRLLGRTNDGLAGNLHLDAAREVLTQVEDPRARTNVTYTVASALTQRADYEGAREWLTKCLSDVDEFGLEFAMPYAKWTLAQIALGQRRFGEAEGALQAIEDIAARTRERHHALNASVLRARLLLQNGEPDAAVQCLNRDPELPLIPSWRGEYYATRALALACIGEVKLSSQAATTANSESAALQVRGLAEAAQAVLALQSPTSQDRNISNVIRFGQRFEIWDPVVCAVRAAPALSDAISARQELRPQLEELYRRISDFALARRAGFRTRATATPKDVLSPREFEVLGLIARGHKNRDISRALFIADSTTKVHVRHILEKLGVRTRAEAVARLKMFESG